MGTVKYPDGKTEEVQFVHDIERQIASQNPDCWLLAPINFLFSGGVVACIIAAEVTGWRYAYIIGGACYLIMLIETCCTRANAYLTHMIAASEID